MAKRKPKLEDAPQDEAPSPDESTDRDQTVNTAVTHDAELKLDVGAAEPEPAEDAERQPGDGADALRRALDTPRELPLLPLRGLVVYPQTTIPLTVGQPRSIRLVDEIVAGDRLVALAASRDPELETPAPQDVY